MAARELGCAQHSWLLASPWAPCLPGCPLAAWQAGHEPRASRSLVPRLPPPGPALQPRPAGAHLQPHRQAQRHRENQAHWTGNRPRQGQGQGQGWMRVASSGSLSAPSPDPEPAPAPALTLEQPAPGRVASEEGGIAPAGEAEAAAEAEDLSPRKPGWRWQANAAELREKVGKLGLAAVLAYGLFDGITYTTFFVLAFLGYEKSTGQNPAANLKALLGIVILMWTGNNVTRPFRVAGAAALAPVLDQGLKRLQKALRLPSQLMAFALVVASFAFVCFSIVGLLILSRLTS